MRGAALHNPPFNVVVSNVRGPGESVTIADARLVDLFSVGPILEGIGLNVTAWSYDGRLNFSLLGCPDLVEDLRPIADGLAPALAELQEVAPSARSWPDDAGVPAGGARPRGDFTSRVAQRHTSRSRWPPIRMTSAPGGTIDGL